MAASVGSSCVARIASINDLSMKESERKYLWPLGPRPDNHPGLSDLRIVQVIGDAFTSSAATGDSAGALLTWSVYCSQ